ncbi:MAG TPA: hypothetical protein VFC13_12155 [Actinomycetes bacterium]|nr:hypothetical protein [Actinomycetes bacterium]
MATISARATQNLSRFNLDLVGLTVRSVTVNGRPAGWSRTDHELQVTPPGRGLRKGRRFTTVVRYDGVPVTQRLVLGPDFTIEAGFIHTDDGAIVAGQPEVAASWFPVNDHPIDKASYTFVVTAPADLQVVATAAWSGASVMGPGAPGSGTRPSRWPRTWPPSTPQFIRLAERVSGQQLDDLFRVWLFTGSKPVLEPAATAQATAAASSAAATLERARGTGRLRR